MSKSTLFDQALKGYDEIIKGAFDVNALVGLFTLCVVFPFYMTLVAIPALVIDVVIDTVTGN